MKKEIRAKFYQWCLGLFLVFCICNSAAFAEEEVIKIQDEQPAGEFFGVPVPMDNYRFVKAAMMIFGARWGAEPTTPQEVENRVWENLLLSYEAHRRNITVAQEELDDEITKLLKAEKVAFDWKKDKVSYEKWVKDRVREPRELFENQLKHLIQLQVLRESVRKSFQPQVTQEEAMQEYMNEYNTLSVEFVQFEDVKAAQAYYAKMKDPKLWEKEAKKNPKFAVRPGFVSLEFLIEVWKIPKEDAYAMLNLTEGSVYKPTSIYRGYGVFHTLEKRVAQKEKFPEVKKSYEEQIKVKKQYEALNDWIRQLKKDADIKVFVKTAEPK
ncbi:MAG: hypothetical protein AAB213_04815 [Candidatus Omnitrophota bacterium]